MTRLPAADRERLKGELGEIAFLAARAAAMTKADDGFAERLDALARNALPADALPAMPTRRPTAAGVVPPAYELAGRAGTSTRYHSSRPWSPGTRTTSAAGT